MPSSWTITGSPAGAVGGGVAGAGSAAGAGAGAAGAGAGAGAAAATDHKQSVFDKLNEAYQGVKRILAEVEKEGSSETISPFVNEVKKTITPQHIIKLRESIAAVVSSTPGRGKLDPDSDSDRPTTAIF